MSAATSHPTAGEITVGEVIELLDGPSAELAAGVANGMYALWLGSGISLGRVEGLKGIITRVLGYLRSKINTGDPDGKYQSALCEALEAADLDATACAAIDFSKPLEEWPEIDVIIRKLAGNYSRFLDARIPGEEPDTLLWDGAGVGSGAINTDDPDAEHLCIAMLALEGVLPDIASANWDSLIEKAMEELSEADSPLMLVCITPEDFRKQTARSRIVKFHGCSTLAQIDPATYRPLLIARESQITKWPTNPDYVVARTALTTLATTRATLMVGLSAQDSNIKSVFSEAEAQMSWGWPSDKPNHVFAEDKIGADQRAILKVVYGAQYDTQGTDICEQSLFRAYAKAFLLGLLLHVVTAKLKTALTRTSSAQLPASDVEELSLGLNTLRDLVAANADGDRTSFARKFAALEGRAAAIFQSGNPPPGADGKYRPLTAQAVSQLRDEPSLSSSGVGQLAAALALIGLGESTGAWAVSTDPGLGILAIRSTSHTGNVLDSVVVFVANSGYVAAMKNAGLIDESDGQLLVIDSGDRVVPRRRSPSRPPGRTGKPTMRTAYMAELLNDAPDLDTLGQRFREVSLL